MTDNVPVDLYAIDLPADADADSQPLVVTLASASRTAAISNLSAMGSSISPSGDTTLSRRAMYPSI